MTSSFRDDNTKWLHFMKALPKVQALEVAIGIQAGSVTEAFTRVNPKTGGKRVRKAGQDLVLIALQNELGTRNIPARPFISTTSDERRTAWYARFDIGINKALYAMGAPNEGFEAAGQLATRDIQKKILAIKTPPNSPRTIEIKGSSDPLVDTGQMRQSIRHVVRPAQ